MSHVPTICAPAMLARSCPVEQVVPAGIYAFHQPPPAVMSLTLCQKLGQLQDKGETAAL